MYSMASCAKNWGELINRPIHIWEVGGKLHVAELLRTLWMSAAVRGSAMFCVALLHIAWVICVSAIAALYAGRKLAGDGKKTIAVRCGSVCGWRITLHLPRPRSVTVKGHRDLFV